MLKLGRTGGTGGEGRNLLDFQAFRVSGLTGILLIKQDLADVKMLKRPIRSLFPSFAIIVNSPGVLSRTMIVEFDGLKIGPLLPLWRHLSALITHIRQRYRPG